MDEEKYQTPDSDRFSSILLMLIALSGEFPIEHVRRLSGSTSYTDFVVKRLKHKKLIRTYCRDGLRGLRLTAAAKKQLAEAEQIRRIVYNILRQEQREQQPRRVQDMGR